MKIVPFLFANSNYAYFSNTKVGLSFRISLKDLSVNSSVPWYWLTVFYFGSLSIESYLLFCH